MRLLQGGERVTACKDEFVDAGGPQRGFLFASASCQIDMSGTGRVKGLRGVFRAFAVDLIGRADADECRAGSLEGRLKCCRVFKPFRR